MELKEFKECVVSFMTIIIHILVALVLYKRRVSLLREDMKDSLLTFFFKDPHNGDMICSECGTISTEKIVSLENEKRVFSDDPESKNSSRIGKGYNPFF